MTEKQARQDATCPHCHKVFSSTSARNLHVRTVHEGKKPHKCSFAGCGYTTADKVTLIRHERTHTGEKPFKCSFPGCTYAATHKVNLIRHERTHTGEKPFKCSFPGCTYETADKANLIRHERTHTGEKPFKCQFPGCTYAATRKPSLKEHAMYLHTNERPHACTEPACGMRFVTTGELKKHVKGYHTPEGIQKKKREEERWTKALLRDGYVMDVANDDSAPVPGHFRREFRIEFRCLQDGSTAAYARIDFVICPIGGSPNVIIFLEIDEHQHRFYFGGVACDVKRIGRVHEALALGSLGFGGVDGVKITWLRYNPNDFTIDEVPQKLDKRERERVLLRRLRDIGASAATDRSGDLEAIEYFCFDADAETAERPLACEDPAFAAYLKSVVRRTERAMMEERENKKRAHEVGPSADGADAAGPSTKRERS
ncbi:general transcription factor IIIA [Pycnococcus provasolii]